MTKENKGFDYICRLKNLKENQVVIGLKESEKIIGQLYPVLVDEEGNILDGQHRLKANPNWRREVVKGVDSERKRAMIRLHSNWHRRRTHPDQVLSELAKVTGWIGAAPYSAFLGCSIRTIQRYLPQKYKLRQRVPKRQLSLTEKQTMNPHEIERYDQLHEEEMKSYGPTLIERLKQGEKPFFTKESCLEMLGNRLYNNVSRRTEEPEKLVTLPEIKEDIEELELMNTSKEEILSFLRNYRSKHLVDLGRIHETEERERIFKEKVEELYAKFRQVTVEFADDTKIPLNMQLIRYHFPYYDGNRSVRPGDPKFLEFYVKEHFLNLIAKQMLRFDERGYSLDGVS